MEVHPGSVDSGEPRFTVAAVARRLGVAPATLRTWHRRYGLGPDQRATGEHRRYGPDDLRRLERMRDLVFEGVPAAEAARLALADDAPPAEQDKAAPPGPATQPGPATPPGPATQPEPAAPPAPAAEPGPAAASVRGLTRAARALNGPATREIIERAIAADGVIGAWDRLLRPVLVAAGDRWARTGAGIDVEHLLSGCIAAVLQEAAVVRPTGSRRSAPVLLACTEDELHSLPILILAAALNERGVAAQVLGPALPRSALNDAVRRTGPPAVFVWSQRPVTADPEIGWAVAPSRVPPRLVVGGPGWDARTPPPPAKLARSLPEAMDLLAG